MAVAVLVGGCSDDSGKGDGREPNANMAASKVCEGTLDHSAAAALQHLSGVDRFDELTGTNEAGESNTFSLSGAVGHLHDEYLERSACRVYKSGDGSGEPLLEVRFSASVNHPPSPEAGGDRVSYLLGVYALAGPTGADLFFRCPTKPTRDGAVVGDTDYVKAEMAAPAGRMRGDSVDRDRMVILNSMARSVAEAAGCASTAALPAQVPEGKDS
ncbi:hypothetical protein OIB37_32275 [Streptomyces sp. NBC_00820]|uniref:hypothetical protein n=1 Tax=Streptomyces sp. NBC_00820 TaxID=2975842 RepID=UPI002ED12DCE|nr:hypothetical protein OIB37_32275 [Streptomyces sp. NBC_00820]